jgi:isocitrate dehydrogenase kinase/phosphatase
VPTAPARHGADIIQRGFEEFHESFRAITRRAKDRFESRDWVGIRRDTVFLEGRRDDADLAQDDCGPC